MALTRGLTSVDKVIAAYNVVVGLVWATAGNGSTIAIPAASFHVVAALIPWLFWGGDRIEPVASSRRTEALHSLYPLAALVIFWIELGPLVEALGRTPLDPWVIAMDRRVFGVHLQAVWRPATDSMLLDEAMHFSYVAYYPLIFLPPIVALVRGRSAAVQDMMFRLMLSYLLCYLVYLWAPTYGPRYMSSELNTTGGGLFRSVMEWAHAAGDSKGTAFPSSHVAGAVTIAVLAWRWFGRMIAGLLTVQAGAVVLATVYTQNHYAIDSLVGLTGVLILQLLIVPFVAARVSTSRGARPLLPDFERLLRSAPEMPAARPFREPRTAGGA